jgi:hypothetical protein
MKAINLQDNRNTNIGLKISWPFWRLMQKLLAILDLQLLGAHITITVILFIILCSNIYRVPINLFSYSEHYFYNENGKSFGYQNYEYWVEDYVAIFRASCKSF